jgi:hypothetical protein
MPITHDLYLSSQLARLWGAGQNPVVRRLSVWDRPRLSPASQPALSSSSDGTARTDQPAGGGLKLQPLKSTVEKL